MAKYTEEELAKLKKSCISFAGEEGGIKLYGFLVKWSSKEDGEPSALSQGIMWFIRIIALMALFVAVVLLTSPFIAIVTLMAGNYVGALVWSIIAIVFYVVLFS